MKLIERYIFKRGMMATLITLCSLTGVVWIIQALREVDIVSTKGQTILAYLSLTSLAVPPLMEAIVPLALMIGCVYAINTLNSNSELVVVNASGASSWMLTKPMLIAALIVSLFAGYITHFISPSTLVRIKAKSADIAADLVSVIVREGEFNEIEKGLTFHIAKRAEGGVLEGIMIADDRDEKKSILYTAAQGIVSTHNNEPVLLLKNGEIHQKDLTNESVTIIRYQSYAFDLSSFSGKADAPKLRPKERPTWQLLNPDINDPFYKQSPELFSARIHQRFSEMLWPFAYVMTILAFAGQARSTRQGHAGALWFAISILIGARAIGFYAANTAKTAFIGSVLMYVIPLVCIVLSAIFVFSNRMVELPKSFNDRIDRNNQAIANYLQSLHTRYIAFRRKMAGV